MVNGVINVRKEKGMTSFGVVARLRKIFGIKKIGHTGTLDPDAEGVLPVCLGKATHLVEELSGGTKSYRAVLLLGVETDTQDSSGQVLAQSEALPKEEEARAALLSFVGKQVQVPPMYSALKVNGKKLVDLARKGIEVERKGREVEFFSIEILSLELPRIFFEVTCSHGTYIRTLCYDVGRKLGCGGCMESLVRTRVEEFCLKDALTLAEIAARKEAEDAAGAAEYSFVLPIDHFYRELPACGCSEGGVEKALLNGGSARLGELVPLAIKSGPGEMPEEAAGCGGNREGRAPDGQRIRIYTKDGALIGIYQVRGGSAELLRFYNV